MNISSFCLVLCSCNVTLVSCFLVYKLSKLLSFYFRMKSASCNASGSKACREKMRRDILNDRHGRFLKYTLSISITHTQVCMQRHPYHSIIVIFRFLELASILDYGRHSKMDKIAVLGDAVRMVNQLRMEAQKLKDSNEEMREKINELKVYLSSLFLFLFFLFTSYFSCHYLVCGIHCLSLALIFQT